MKLILIALLVLINVSLSFGEVWTLHKIDLQKYPNARCLDGSPAGFWVVKGTGTGSDKFIIHHQGGGWCVDETDCYNRSLTDLGSSSSWVEVADCNAGSQAQPCVYDGNQGIFGFDPAKNPVTYNWNRLFLGYCDGGSYSGHVEAPVPVPNSEHVVHFQGRYILDAVYDMFLSEEIGMNRASEVIISGTSAGGLSVYLHADYLHQKILAAAQAVHAARPRVVAVPDAGYFMDLPSVSGEYLYTPIYQNVFRMQQVQDSVNDACIAHYTASGDTWKCFMAQYTLPFVKTPVFVVNSFVDSWQGPNIMGLFCDPRVNCADSDIVYLNDFRQKMLDVLQTTFLTKPNAGAWLCECWEHPLVNWDHNWVDVSVQTQSLGDTFAAWYTHDKTKGSWVVVDGEWGSNQC